MLNILYATKIVGKHIFSISKHRTSKACRLVILLPDMVKTTRGALPILTSWTILRMLHIPIGKLVGLGGSLNGHGSAWAEGLADSIFFYKLEAYIEQKDCQIAAQTYVCLIASFTGDSSVSAVGPRPGLSCLLHGVELLKSPKPRKSTKHMHPRVDFSFPSRCSLDCSWRFNLKRTLIFLVTLVNFPTTWHGCCFKGLPLFAQRTRLYRRSRTRASSSLHSTSIGMGM